jgi:hypothetical protein
MTDAPVTVLVCEAGGLVIGVDCADVHAVVSNAGSERDRALAERLFGRRLRAATAARTLVMRTSTGGPRIVVDRVLGMRSLARAELRPLPESVRALGAADWVLGLAQFEQEFVWLLDLAWALTEQSPEPPT